MDNRKTIKIVGPCSKWIEGEGWVTEIPVKFIEEHSVEQHEYEKEILAGNIFHAIMYNSVKRTGKETGETYYQISETMLRDLAYQYGVDIPGNSRHNCKYNSVGYCDIEKGNGDFNECQRVCEYFEEDK